MISDVALAELRIAIQNMVCGMWVSFLVSFLVSGFIFIFLIYEWNQRTSSRQTVKSEIDVLFLFLLLLAFGGRLVRINTIVIT